ncbi:MAG: YbaB/EbfC family nucleoid-associated protein [Clostridia bacterium]|nr:YbaB/EbfC family nucleoid-associated protein [Clostridia bacterium]
MAKGNMGGNNLNNLMKQAQKMQAEMQRAQAELESAVFEGNSGGGAVTVVFNGKKQLQRLTITPDVVDPDDVEMLQDLIVAAINQAFEIIDKETESKMGRVTGGMKIPGL